MRFITCALVFGRFYVTMYQRVIKHEIPLRRHVDLPPKFHYILQEHVFSVIGTVAYLQ